MTIMRRRIQMGCIGMKTLRLLVGDPARAGDSFGILGLEGTYPEKKIYIRLAKEFKRESYGTVANYFSKIHKKLNFDMLLIEKNFDYDEVSKAFARLPITYVTTSANLTEETRAKGWSVDKPYMIKWLKPQYEKHAILYPSTQSSAMQELINQRNEVVGITAPSGHVSYKRQRGRHDDLFLCELIGCNAIRIWWNMQ